MAICHECGAQADETCERCQRPTCADSYYEREHLGLCKCCHQELTAHPFDLTHWPYKLRKPFPE
jgi:hypothetical protein